MRVKCNDPSKVLNLSQCTKHWATILKGGCSGFVLQIEQHWDYWVPANCLNNLTIIAGNGWLPYNGHYPVADPDFRLRGEGGGGKAGVFCLPSVIFFIFYPK